MTMEEFGGIVHFLVQKLSTNTPISFTSCKYMRSGTPHVWCACAGMLAPADADDNSVLSQALLHWVVVVTSTW